MADDIDRMIGILRERKKAKLAANDPSTAARDSVAVSKERAVRGTATAADSTRLRMERVPGFEAPEPVKLTDKGYALARIRSGQGDKADSIMVGLQPSASTPRTPSYTIRQGVDPKTGQPVFLRSNSLTGGLEPVKTEYRPSQGKKEDDGEREYVSSLRRSNEIQSGISKIDAILNDPKLKDGAGVQDEFGETKYVDRAALAKERDGLLKEQRIHQRKINSIEDRQISATPAGPKGHTIQSPNGRVYVSDGKKYIPKQ